MKTLLMATAAMMLIAAPAFADDTGNTTNVEANVPAVCKIVHSPNTIKVKTNVYQNGSTIGTIKLDNSPQVKTVTVFCNTPGSTLAISRTPLTNPYPLVQASIDAGFTNQIGFNADLKGGREGDPTSAWWDTDGNHSPGGSYAYGVYQGDLTLSVNNVAPIGGTFPVDGAYTGAITITLTPGV